MNKTKKSIRQGDLLFIPRSEMLTKKNSYTPYLQKNGIIREGEATGHHHRLETPADAKVFRPTWAPAVVVVGKLDKPYTRVIHEEHGPVELESDTTYDVHVAREFDLAEGNRYVAD